MFRGTFEHLIDAKGRISIPARFRELVQASGRAEVVITRSPINPPPCLEAYPIEEWRRFEEEYLARNGFQRRFDRVVKQFEDLYFGNAHTCEIDTQGRILVPPALRDWAGLSKDVVFSGALDRFRLWSKDAWSASQTQAEAEFQNQPDALGRLSF
ncbi:MAG: transcriptional regulator MraZ [Candidatus Binatota bacterium]|nr:transcriptional regulator MraZ [Candidatus Binatota bacterium]